MIAHKSTKTNLHSLLSEIEGQSSTEKIVIPTINYHQLISNQHEIIKSLQNEIKYLRQYSLYFRDEVSLEKELETDCSLNAEDGKKNQEIRGTRGGSKGGTALQELIREIMEMLDVKGIDEVMGKMKIILEKANRKIEPIFVERIKIKEVPVAMEVIKEVEKEVIIYRDKIIEVPVFREKIIEKFTAVDDNVPNQKTSNLKHLYEEPNEVTTKGSSNNNKAAYFHEKQRYEDSYTSPSNQKNGKLNYMQSPKNNQTIGFKSPRYKGKEDNKNKWDQDVNGFKSPKYKQKEDY